MRRKRVEAATALGGHRAEKKLAGARRRGVRGAVGPVEMVAVRPTHGEQERLGKEDGDVDIGRQGRV